MRSAENNEVELVFYRNDQEFKMEEEEKPRPSPVPERRIIREDRDSPNREMPRIEPTEPWPDPGKPEKQ